MPGKADFILQRQNFLKTNLIVINSNMGTYRSGLLKADKERTHLKHSTSVSGSAQQSIYRKKTTIHVKLSEFANASVTDAENKIKKVYELIADENELGGKLEASADSFPVYWLAYEKNRTMRLHLQAEPEFMFTANMDGCSFGKGSQKSGNGVLVTHANADTDSMPGFVESKGANHNAKLGDKQDLQNILQHERSAEKLMRAQNIDIADGVIKISASVSGLERSKRESYSATVIGFLLDGNWRFFMQRYQTIVDGSNKIFIFKSLAEL